MAKAAAPQLAKVIPFALTSPSQFRPEAPPELTSDRYAEDFNEILAAGGANSGKRMPEQSETALFHGLNPNVFWTTNLRAFVSSRSLNTADSARLYAMLYVSIADAVIACWDAKFHYNFWRPVTAIRSAETDGNPATNADLAWLPLVTTPPHPEYPAAHSCVAASVAEVLHSYFGTTKLDMSFASTAERPTPKVHFYATGDDLVKEIADARVFGGIYFRTSTVQGEVIGRQVGRWITSKYFRPRRTP